MNFNIKGLWNKVKRNKNLGGKVKLDIDALAVLTEFNWYKHVQSFPSTHRIS